jgi:hypothetical protein
MPLQVFLAIFGTQEMALSDLSVVRALEDTKMYDHGVSDLTPEMVAFAASMVSSLFPFLNMSLNVL